MGINPLSSFGGNSAFSVDGVISGMKTSDIIAKMMSIEAQPITLFQVQKQKVQDRDKAYQDIRAKLVSFQGSLQNLFQASSVNVKSASVTAPTGTSPILSATATSDAVSGTYQVNVSQLATASTIGTSRPISKGVNTTAVLNSAGFTTPPTAGTLTVNGVTITIDPTVDTLNSVVNKIKDSSLGGTGVGTGVNAVITNDANGNPNGITLTPISGTQAVQLGSGSDTSNFLSAAHLVATNVLGGAVASNAPLSAATPGNALSGQPFNLSMGTTLAGSGTFTINGTAITWSNTDTLSTVLNRINSSTANVKATYDPTADKVTLTNMATGNQSISLSEAASPPGQSGLMAALGLLGPNAVSTAGKTAQYTIAVNGGAAGPTQYSNSNTVTNALPGVTFNLTATGTNNTLTITQDTSTAAKNVQALVDNFNAFTDLIDTDTKYDPTSKKGSVLMGDAGIQGLQSKIKSLLSSAAVVPSGSAYKTLADIGISSGAYGSAPNSTNHLVLDQTKLSAALQNNPNAVFQALSGLAGTASLTDASGNPLGIGTSWLQSLSGSPTGNAMSGVYRVTYNPSLGSNNLSAVFNPLGGSSQPAITGSIVASGTNSMITGLTLTAKGAPVAGTEYVKYTLTNGGVLQNVNNFVNSILAPGGMFDAESSSATAQSQSIDAQIASMNNQLSLRQTTLQKQFTAMEVALNQLQMQGASLAQKLGSTGQ